MLKCRALACAEPGQLLAHRPHRHRESHRDFRHSLARSDVGDDLFSTVNGQVGIMIRVVHPSGPLAGVWRLQPNSVLGEQPPETSKLLGQNRFEMRLHLGYEIWGHSPA